MSAYTHQCMLPTLVRARAVRRRSVEACHAPASMYMMRRAAACSLQVPDSFCYECSRPRTPATPPLRPLSLCRRPSIRPSTRPGHHQLIHTGHPRRLCPARFPPRQKSLQGTESHQGTETARRCLCSCLWHPTQPVPSHTWSTVDRHKTTETHPSSTGLQRSLRVH